MAPKEFSMFWFSIRPVLLATTAALALAACATPTPYQPAGTGGARGGYAEQRLEADRFRVTFAGNSVTSREQVETSLLLRAAEITLENGADWFQTANRATDRDTRYRTTPNLWASRYGPYWGPSWRYYSRGYWSRWGDPFDDFDVRAIDRYEASAEILLGRGPKPANDPNAFDAREVVANLSGRVMRPQS